MRKLRSAAPAATRANFALAPRPERLVLDGYRCWQAGYETGDIACWEIAWNGYARSLGPRRAKAALGELACWVRALRASTCRQLHVYPHSCCHITADEVRAVCLVGACQAGKCPLARSLACSLLATCDVDHVVDASRDFALVLADADMLMSWTGAAEASLHGASNHPTGPAQ